MKKAFTLIELLVVLAILAIMAIGVSSVVIRSNSGDPTVFMDPSEKLFYLEQKRANDIREKELELQYQHPQPPATNP